MAFYTAFNSLQSYHGDSSHHSCLSCVSPVLGRGSEVSCQRTFHEKTQRIHNGSNPGSLDYESNTFTTELPRTPFERRCGNGKPNVFLRVLLKSSLDRKDEMRWNLLHQGLQVLGVFHSPVLERYTVFLNTVLKCLKGMFQQFYCSVLNGVFSELCSFTLKYDSTFHHLESRGNSVSRYATPRFI